MAANRVIGSRNGIPWNLPSDLKQFKETTMGYPLIMGRKTFESIGRPLPGRKTLVVTRNTNYSLKGATLAGSLEEALEKCRESTKVFIAGGGEIFRQALPLADTIILSVLDREVEGDVYFPEIPPEQFVETEKKIMENGVDDEMYSVVILKRRK